MKKIVFIIGFAALAVLSYGQDIPDAADNGPVTKPLPEKKVEYSFTTGTSFFSSPGFARGTSFYAAPEFRLKLSPKFKVDAGIMLSQNRLSFSKPVNLTGESSVVVKQAPMYDGLVYASGTYNANSRLTFSGSFYKNFTPGGTYQYNALDNSFQMMSFGVNYKLTEHVSIGAGMRMLQSNGLSPYLLQDNYMPASMNRPFIY